MRYAITLAAIPLPLLMWVAWPKAAVPIVTVKAVATEGVRAQRMDDSTFRARWQPVYLGPMVQLPAARPSRVSTVAADETLAGGRASARQPSPRIVRRASLRQTCAPGTGCGG